jgi:hypothetical protein
VWLRRLIILGTPLFIAIIELGHPRLLELEFDKLSPMVNQWLMIQLLQLPLFGLLALAVYLLTHPLRGTSAFVNYMAMGVFAVFYTAYDAILGISTGVLIRN